MAVHVIDTIKPKNNLDFPVVEDGDVLIVSSGKRLSEVVATMATQAMIEALSAAVDSLGLVVQNGCLCIMYESEE